MSRSAVYERLSDWFDKLTGDYTTSTEVRAFIDAEKADPAHAAELAALSNELVYSALMGHAGGQRRVKRSEARRAATQTFTRQRIAQAAENLAAGRPSGLFDYEFKVDDKGTMRRVADMDGPAHSYVASRYTNSSKKASLEAAFHCAVAKKCGLRRTSEVFTSSQYEAMYRSIVRSDAA